ncbi:MAG: hypothetical protein WBM35_02910, partial [Candidatus Electrothrix sp.]
CLKNNNSEIPMPRHRYSQQNKTAGTFHIPEGWNSHRRHDIRPRPTGRSQNRDQVWEEVHHLMKYII